MREDAASAAEGSTLVVEHEQQDHISWSPVALVEKWDQDQVDWVIGKSGIAVPDGTLLGKYLEPYEIVEAKGNLLTTAGLTRITSLITAGGGQGATNTSARTGVGNSATAATVGQTDLQASSGSSNRQFNVMDATFPSVSAGVITFKSTFASGEANFVWNEWCIDIGTPTVSAGTTVNACMLNRKVESLGTKSSGSWALTTTITLA